MDMLNFAEHSPQKFRLIPRSSKRTLLTGFITVLLACPVSAGSVNYTYDTLGRLQTATYSNGMMITYSYDATGNRSSQVTTGAP